ncbi:hypothetical protein [Neptunomonas sp. XY-337]|uniref:hypothetical protein n=1 Tax=Neptunomonas sp. XY-337 TaxID=2561897 RepID=UPI0010AA8E20|nr:hypothetical protein [Neptunomonas sp. XY-337]
MNITGALYSGAYSTNRVADNTPKVAGDNNGTGKPEVAEIASGRPVDNAVQQTTVDPNAQAPTTKVVSDASEVLGTNIDVRA